MMRRQAPVAAIAVFTLMALLPCGKTASAQGPAVMLEPTQLRKLFSDFLDVKRQLFFTATKQTCSTDPCVVTINLSTTRVNDKDYCLASLPESLEFSPPTGNAKTIRWTLSTGQLLGRTVEFHEDAGILKVDDGKAQFSPDSKRTSPTVFEGTNKHNKKATASYVPVILFRTAEGVPELCAVGDPKIINP